VPYHGTWGEVYPIPFQGRERRFEYLKRYGGIDEDYEAIPETTPYTLPHPPPAPAPRPTVNLPAPTLAGFPLGAREAADLQASTAARHRAPVERTVEIGQGVMLDLVLIPAGEFVMGNPGGSADELPLHRVGVSRPFWMGRFEIRNREYALFNPAHDSGYINQLATAVASRGYSVNGPDQPVVRVSWQDATDFCEWLSRQTGLRFSLPTESQWEYACRAGTATPMWYGSDQAIFDRFGNMADRKLEEMSRRVPGKFLYSHHPDWVLRDDRSFDHALVTANVGSYEPNPWGLHDMHGNVAEWTRSMYRPYPYAWGDGRDAMTTGGRRVARGGSWYDRPKRCASGFRLDYPEWQPVYNVGFRVVAELDPPSQPVPAATD
jgi:formylglycine-generating enzyme required for sulfatase activity